MPNGARGERFKAHQNALRAAFLLTLVRLGATLDEAERWSRSAMRGKGTDGLATWHKVRVVMERWYSYSFEHMRFEDGEQTDGQDKDRVGR